MKFVYSDGGRSKYFRAQHVGDCVVRAIALATGKDYKDVYDDINMLAKKSRAKSRSSARDGVDPSVSKKYIESLGWRWHPTCGVGKGVTMHLCDDEIPDGNLIVRIAGHIVNVKNGIVYDTWDCSQEKVYLYEDGSCKSNYPAVYGYWTKQ